MKNKLISGQIALMVLLISTVMLTLGLSLSKKTVIETRVDTADEEAKKAFNAAESGIDYYLGTGRTDYSSPIVGRGSSVTVTDLQSGLTINLGSVVDQNSAGFFWLVGHDANDNIDLNTYYRGNNLVLCVSNDLPSVEIGFYYYINPNYYVIRHGYNFSGLPQSMTNYQTIAATEGQCGAGSNYNAVDLSSLLTGRRPLLLAVRPYFTSAKMKLVGSPVNPFPSQGKEISSLGYSGDFKRRVSVWRSFKVPLFMLDSLTAFDGVLSQ